MKKETKIVSLLAAATFTASMSAFYVQSINSTENVIDNESIANVVDFYYNNTAGYHVFGSTTTIKHEGEMNIKVFNFYEDVKEKLDYLDLLGSTTEGALGFNNLYNINETSVNQRVGINFELYTILSETKILYEISDGIFDVNAGHLFNYLDKYFDSELDMHITLDGFLTGEPDKWTTFDEALLLEEENGKYYATRKNENTKVDLGGYLKGYAAEYVRDLAKNQGLNIYTNAGSSSITNISEEPKNIWVESPRPDEMTCAYPNYENNNFEECMGIWKNQNDYHISTSGDYVNKKIVHGHRYHHLVNPKTGEFKQDVGIVSVLSKEPARYLDALSSILFITDESKHKDILSHFTEEIHVVYPKINVEQDNFEKVTYLHTGEEDIFEINDLWKVDQ